MPERYPNLKTNDARYPVRKPSDATLAFAKIPGRLAWLEGDGPSAFGPGLIVGTKWYDRMTRVGYPITGTLVGGDPVGTKSRSGAAFGGTQSVDLGDIFPTSDYAVLIAYKQSTETAALAHGLLGGKTTPYHSVHLAKTTGRINVQHSSSTSAIYAGVVNHAAGSLRTLLVTFDREVTPNPGATHRRVVWVDGVKEADDTATWPLNNDASCVLGDIPGLTGSDVKFRGTIFHASVWNQVPNDDDRAAMFAYLAEQYA